MEIPVISKAARRRRINNLIDRLSAHEAAMRGIAAALLELSDPDDDLSAEVRRLVAALDG